MMTTHFDVRDWRSIRDDREKYADYLCSREWSEKREAVRQRSGGICERCQVNPMDACHHLTYLRKYRERLEDLQAICTGCHDFIHGKSNSDPCNNRETWPPAGTFDIYGTFELAIANLEEQDRKWLFEIVEAVIHNPGNNMALILIRGKFPDPETPKIIQKVVLSIREIIQEDVCVCSVDECEKYFRFFGPHGRPTQSIRVIR